MSQEKHSMDEHPERRYHSGAGHRVPFFITFAWTVFLVAAVVYLARYSWPDLLLWLGK